MPRKITVYFLLQRRARPQSSAAEPTSTDKLGNRIPRYNRSYSRSSTPFLGFSESGSGGQPAPTMLDRRSREDNAAHMTQGDRQQCKADGLTAFRVSVTGPTHYFKNDYGSHRIDKELPPEFEAAAAAIYAQLAPSSMPPLMVGGAASTSSNHVFDENDYHRHNLGEYYSPSSVNFKEFPVIRQTPAYYWPQRRTAQKQSDMETNKLFLRYPLKNRDEAEALQEELLQLDPNQSNSYEIASHEALDYGDAIYLVDAARILRQSVIEPSNAFLSTHLKCLYVYEAEEVICLIQALAKYQLLLAFTEACDEDKAAFLCNFAGNFYSPELWINVHTNRNALEVVANNIRAEQLNREGCFELKRPTFLGLRPGFFLSEDERRAKDKERCETASPLENPTNFLPR